MTLPSEHLHHVTSYVASPSRNKDLHNSSISADRPSSTDFVWRVLDGAIRNIRRPGMCCSRRFSRTHMARATAPLVYIIPTGCLYVMIFDTNCNELNKEGENLREQHI